MESSIPTIAMLTAARAHMYALGAPLSLDWGSQYNPHISGSYYHNNVVAEKDIGVAWWADNIPVDTAAPGGWSSGSQTAFERFDLSRKPRDRRLFERRWPPLFGRGLCARSRPMQAIRSSLFPTPSRGPGCAGLGKVFNMNFMAQGAVQSTAGTINPVQRTYVAFGSPQDLPSTSTPLSLAAGQNHFSFIGQWLIDWDLYQLSNETQQVLVGNFGS